MAGFDKPDFAACRLPTRSHFGQRWLAVVAIVVGNSGGVERNLFRFPSINLTALGHLREFKPRTDANQRECLEEHLIRVYLHLIRGFLVLVMCFLGHEAAFGNQKMRKTNFGIKNLLRPYP